MRKTIAFTKDLNLLVNEPLEQLEVPQVLWYWLDITAPDEDDILLLREHFHFHHLAIEDCLQLFERPKVDFYEKYNFFILNVLNQKTLEATDLDMFVGENYVITLHREDLAETHMIREKIIADQNAWDDGHLYIAYLIFDKIVDQYFPAIYRIEDDLGDIDIRVGGNAGQSIINRVFNLRNDLLKLRRIINSMKELTYRILKSEHLEGFRNNKFYFNDIYDHLLKLSDTIESNREMTADMRDSYLALNSNRTNIIMTILTIVSSVFIPLTFIVGVYGMNFEYMPELQWKSGYFIIMGIMAAIGVSMFLWFKIKGWLDIYK